MKKRHYERPKSKVINLRTGSPLCTSGTLEPEKPGGPVSAKRQNYIWEDVEEEQQ